MKMKKIIFTVTVVLLVAAFGTSAFLVGSYVLDGRKQEQRNEELSNIVANAQAQAQTTAAEPAPTQQEKVPEQTQSTEATQATEPAEKTILPGYQEVYEQNNDLVGWIQLDDPNNPEVPKFSYAVMQTPEEKDYYLYRDFDGNYSKRGSIYTWEKADINKPSDNITIFGHNMADGSMFTPLNDYVHKYTWENNSLIFFNTLYEYHTYKIFAVFKTTAAEGLGFPYHRFVDAANREEFDAFVKTCKDLAFYDTGITPVYGDKLICLSTCEYTDPYDNGRLVIAAFRLT